jgi:putative hydrolase of the HAD superfamily
MRWPGPLVFDLDDTLYLERDFVRSGFAAVERWFADQQGPPGLAQACRHLFQQGHRGRIFDEALAGLGVAADPSLIAQLVEIYRSHPPDIALAPDAEGYLAGRGDGARNALVTDGPLATQRAKVQALGIEGRFGFIVYTDALGPGRGKPHPAAFERIETWASGLITPRETSGGLPLVYIADNPRKDFVTPRDRGWLTVQIVRPDRVHRVDAPDENHAAHARIESLDQLDACLLGLSETLGSDVGTFPTDTARRLPVS